MANAWPRNIVPYTEDQLHVLSDVGAIALLFSVLDRPQARATLRGERLGAAERLLKVGLLEERDGTLRATATHRRDPDGHTPAVLARRAAMLDFTQTIVTDARSALHARREAAYAGVGVVTLPDRPTVLARAGAILAEAEDQLRALAEEEPLADGEPALRALVAITPTN